MKKCSGSVLTALLLIGVSVVGCNSSTTVNPTGESNRATAITAPETPAPETAAPPSTGGGISVSVLPDGWNKVEGSVLPAQYMKGSTSFMAKTESFPGEDLNVIVAQATEAFKRSFTNVAMQGSPETIQVGGQDARRIVFTCEVSRMKMKYTYVYTRFGGKTWAITFGGLENSFDALSADYQSILSAIRFS